MQLLQSAMRTWLLPRLDSSWSLRISLKPTLAMVVAMVVSMVPLSLSCPSWMRVSAILCFLFELLWPKLVLAQSNLFSGVSLKLYVNACWMVPLLKGLVFEYLFVDTCFHTCPLSAYFVWLLIFTFCWKVFWILVFDTCFQLFWWMNVNIYLCFAKGWSVLFFMFTKYFTRVLEWWLKLGVGVGICIIVLEVNSITYWKFLLNWIRFGHLVILASPNGTVFRL
jgi:hypothetical protein